MYIGRLGDGSNPDDGIYILVKEVIDNSIDEFIMGNGKRIDIQLKDNKVAVRDYGRGIPLGKVVECVSVINTGAKYNDDVFQFSVGLNGVGTKAVNALSSWFRVVSVRDGKCSEAVFERGVLKTQRTGKVKPDVKNGTLVEFIPDEELFHDYQFSLEFLQKRIWNYAYLNTGLTLVFNGDKYVSQNGLLDLLEAEMGTSSLYPMGYYKGKQLEFAFTHSNNYGENYFSFVNGQYTSDGEPIFPRSRKVFSRESTSTSARATRARMFVKARPRLSRSRYRRPCSKARRRTSSEIPKCEPGLSTKQSRRWTTGSTRILKPPVSLNRKYSPTKSFAPS